MPPPVLPVVDDFNRANGALTTGYQAAFSDGGGAIPTVSSNQLASGTGSATDSGFVYLPVGHCTDCEISCTVTALSSPTTDSIVKFRVHALDSATRKTVPPNSASWSGIQMRTLGDGNMITEKYDGASATTIEDPGGPVGVLAVNDRIGLSVAGGLVQMWFKNEPAAWELVGFGVIDETYQSGYLGLAFDEGTARIDNFSCGVVFAGTPSSRRGRQQERARA